MINSFLSEQWMFIAFIFFGVIGYISWIRWRDHHWIESRFQKKDVIAMSFGVSYFGRSSEPGKPERSGGFLVLLKDRLFFYSRWSKREIDIPGSAITRIYPDSAHKGVDLHQSILKVDFLIENGKTDSAAFRVPYPPQWVNAISNICPRINEESSQAD